MIKQHHCGHELVPYGKFNHRYTMCVTTAPTNPHPGAIHISPRGRGTLGDALECAPVFVGTPVYM